MPALDVILPRAAFTATLLVAAGAVSFGLAGLLAWAANRRKGGSMDRIVGGLAFAAYPVPVFALSFALLFVLAGQLRWFPVGGNHSIPPPPDFLGQIADRAYHGFLPVMALAAASFGFVSLSLREGPGGSRTPQAGNRVEDAGSSRSPDGNISVSTSVVGAVALYAGWMVAADAFVELVFNLDGLGSLVWRAIFAFDFFVLSAIFLRCRAGRAAAARRNSGAI